MPSATPPLCPVAGEMSPEDLKALLTEIGATPESLERDAAALREWVISQPHLPDLTVEYDEWLVTFLMAGKNSMEKAKTRLDNYFTTRTVLSDWFTMPPPPEDQLIVSQSQYLLNGWLPRVLPNGYILLMDKYLVPDGDWSGVDLKLHFQRVVMHCDAMLALSKKLRGVILLVDEKNINLSIITTFLANIGLFRKTMNCIQDCFPLRLNSVHIVNPVVPSMQKMILTAITPLLKGKLAQRIHVHENMKTLHEHVPAEYLPKDYGGSSPNTLEEAAVKLSNFIAGSKDWFGSRTWMKTNEDRRVEKRNITSDAGVEGSFRKLTVD